MDTEPPSPSTCKWKSPAPRPRPRRRRQPSFLPCPHRVTGAPTEAYTREAEKEEARCSSNFRLGIENKDIHSQKFKPCTLDDGSFLLFWKTHIQIFKIKKLTNSFPRAGASCRIKQMKEIGRCKSMWLLCSPQRRAESRRCCREISTRSVGTEADSSINIFVEEGWRHCGFSFLRDPHLAIEIKLQRVGSVG